jgi:hypothetical protein
LIAAASAVILAVLNPPLLLSASTPTGGDMGAHVFAPLYLRDVLLPQGRILGWSQAWFAGFPAFYFYFPLPSLVIVLLDLILPYGVAFKLVTVAGLLGMPAASYFLARSLKFGPTVAGVASAAGAALAFMESYSIYGANIASTLAGEFTFSWSFTLSLVYIGLLTRTLRDDRRYLPWTALTLGLVALCHVITTIIVVIATLPTLRWKGAIRTMPVVWAWGFAIAAFWALPLLARIGLSSDLAWTPLSRWEEILPIEIWLLLPAAVAGAVWSIRRTQRVVPVLTFTLFPLIYYPLPLVLPDLFPGVFTGERWKLWNGRLLPYWYFGVVFFAALALGGMVMWASRRLPEQVGRMWPRLAGVLGGVAAILVTRSDRFPSWAPWVALAVTVLGVGISFLWVGRVSAARFLGVGAAAVLGLGALAGLTFVSGWARWNFSGYEGKSTWTEYRALMATIEGLPEGRVMWEYHKEMDKYGTPMALMLMPMWTNGTHPSMEGLFFESSLSTPFHFLNQSEMSLAPSQPVPGLDYHPFDFARGLPHMALYNVRYYVTYTEDARLQALEFPELTEVAASPPFTVFELPDSSLVDVASFVPSVYEPADSGGPFTTQGDLGQGDPAASPPATFNEAALEWYDDLSLLDHWMVEKGPLEWPRVGQVGDLTEASPYADTGAVSDVKVDDHRISFTTDAVGVPHLVKVSYFPNWKVMGGDGPYLAAPSLMVVIPTQEHVVLSFANTWAENAGNVLTLIALAGFLVPLIRRRMRPSNSSGDVKAGTP